MEKKVTVTVMHHFIMSIPDLILSGLVVTLSTTRLKDSIVSTVTKLQAGQSGVRILPWARD